MERNEKFEWLENFSSEIIEQSDQDESYLLLLQTRQWTEVVSFAIVSDFSQRF